MHKYQLDSSFLEQSRSHVSRRETMNISKNEEKPQILPQKRQREDGDDDQSFAHMLGDDDLSFVHMTDSCAQVEVHPSGLASNQHQNPESIGTSNNILMTEYLQEILTGKKPQIEDIDDDLSFIRMLDRYNVQVEVHSPGLAHNQHQKHGLIGTSNSVAMTEYLRDILTGEKPQIEDNDDDDLSFVHMLDCYNVQVQVHSSGLAPNQHQNHGLLGTSNSVAMTEYPREILTEERPQIENNENDLSFVHMLDFYDVQLDVHSPGLATNQHQNYGSIDTNYSLPMTEYLQELPTEEKPQIEANDDDLSFVPSLDSYNLLVEVHSPGLALNQHRNYGAMDTRNSVPMTEHLQEISRVEKPQIEGDDDDLSFFRMLNSYNAQLEVHSSGETIADHIEQETHTLTVPDTTEPSIENYYALRMIDECLNSSRIEEEEEEANAAGNQWQDYGLLDIIACPAVEELASLERLPSVSQNEDDPRFSITTEELLKFLSTENKEDSTLPHKPVQTESDLLLLQNPVEAEALPHEEKHETRDVVAEFSIEEWIREMEDQNWIEEIIPE